MAENWEWKIGARRFEAKNWEWKIWGRKFEAENWGGKSLQNFPPQFFFRKICISPEILTFLYSLPETSAADLEMVIKQRY